MEESATTVEEMIAFAMEHLEHADLKVRKETVERLAIKLFPKYRHRQEWMWQSRDNITRVTLWGQEHVRDNTILAMVKEKLGLGPKYYWIVGSRTLFFSDRLFYISSVLPWNKFCIKPQGLTTLQGPFLNESRKEMATEILKNRIPPQDMPHTCFGGTHPWYYCPYAFCDPF